MRSLDSCFNVIRDDSPVAKALVNNLKVYPNFPKEGINFVDVFPVLANKYLMARLPSYLVKYIVDKEEQPTAVVAPESRGFLFGVLVARELGVPFYPFRKPGKLPGMTIKKSYTLEYGTDVLEFPAGTLKADDNVLIVDDLIAVGGTMNAMASIIKDNTKAKVHSGLVLLNLVDIPKSLSVPVSFVLGLEDK